MFLFRNQREIHKLLSIFLFSSLLIHQDGLAKFPVQSSNPTPPSRSEARLLKLMELTQPNIAEFQIYAKALWRESPGRMDALREKMIIFFRKAVRHSQLSRVSDKDISTVLTFFATDLSVDFATSLASEYFGPNLSQWMISNAPIFIKKGKTSKFIDFMKKNWRVGETNWPQNLESEALQNYCFSLRMAMKHSDCLQILNTSSYSWKLSNKLALATEILDMDLFKKTWLEKFVNISSCDQRFPDIWLNYYLSRYLYLTKSYGEAKKCLEKFRDTSPNASHRFLAEADLIDLSYQLEPSKRSEASTKAKIEGLNNLLPSSGEIIFRYIYNSEKIKNLMIQRKDSEALEQTRITKKMLAHTDFELQKAAISTIEEYLIARNKYNFKIQNIDQLKFQRFAESLPSLLKSTTH